ncbi:MAG: DUF2938 family protein [Betaproteobacteria bacterium]|nr:DUF2938 family protein [Betaproteobacteria bacterium]
MEYALPMSMRILLLGTLATALLDLWMLTLKRFKVPMLDMALLGRWCAHLLRGQPVRGPIAAAGAITGERELGWALHYAIGIAFAALFAGFVDPGWLHHPAPGPALLFGLATVAAPLFILQPAMGAGIASSRTRTPLRNVLKSTLNHAVFGGGLYLAAICLSLLP